MADPNPYRQPLSEKQAFIDAMDDWPDKEAQRRRLQGLIYGVTGETTKPPPPPPPPQTKAQQALSLQVRAIAFLKGKSTDTSADKRKT